MCHSLAPSREMDLGRAGGFDNWAGGRKAQKSQWERREHTYLLCSINNLCEGKREKQKAKESTSFIRSTPVLRCFHPRIYPCQIASVTLGLSLVPGSSLYTVKLQGTLIGTVLGYSNG